MRSEKFHVKYDTDYVLFAIRSKIEDYQLAYFLNKSSSFLFKRMSPDVSFLLNKRPVYFSSFYDNRKELLYWKIKENKLQLNDLVRRGYEYNLS